MNLNKIVLIPNTVKDKNLIHTHKLLDFFRKKNSPVYLGEDLKNKVSSDNAIFLPYNTLFSGCGLIVALGGDGTILRIVQSVYRENIPIIGINLGKIGFMSEIETNELSLLDNLYTGNYKTENRMMLDILILDPDGSTVLRETALNEVVLSNGTISRMINVNLNVDGNQIADYRADGIITATPTGSTAYSLSAGGPIISPEVECFCVTPVCSHSLIQRPFIFSAESVIELKNSNDDETEVYFTADGHDNIRIGTGCKVRVRKSDSYTRLISIKKNIFIKKLLSIN